MTEFRSVFSTTLKVLLALFLISVGLALILSLIVIGTGGTLSIGSGNGKIIIWNGDSSSSHNSYLNNKKHYDERADKKHTRMPQSEWNEDIAKAIKTHCAEEGMTKEEAENALGKPTKSYPTASGYNRGGDNGETWQYERTTQGKCLRYDGDECTEYKNNHEIATLYFSPNGHLIFLFEDNYLSCWQGLNHITSETQ